MGNHTWRMVTTRNFLAVLKITPNARASSFCSMIWSFRELNTYPNPMQINFSHHHEQSNKLFRVRLPASPMTSNVALASHARTSTFTPLEELGTFSACNVRTSSDRAAFDPINDEKGFGIHRLIPEATASFAKVATGEKGSTGVEALPDKSTIPNHKLRSCWSGGQ